MKELQLAILVRPDQPRSVGVIFEPRTKQNPKVAKLLLSIFNGSPINMKNVKSISVGSEQFLVNYIKSSVFPNTSYYNLNLKQLQNITKS